MTRAARRTKKEIEFDARDAVRDAADRAGLSVADWIDRVVASYADQIGISVLDVNDDIRREAISKRLDTLARQSARESVRRGDFDVLDMAYDRPKKRRTRAADFDDDGAEPHLHQANRRTDRGEQDRSLHGIEDQLARLTDRMDRLLSAPPARPEERRPMRARPERVTMRSIEEAVSEIARRQNDLSHDRSAERMPSSVALKNEIASLAQRLEETRSEFSQSTLAHAVEGRIDQLSSRIDEVMKEIEGHLTTPRHDLETLQALQSQIAQLSDRLERSDLSADGVTSIQRTMLDLFRYVEDMRTASLEQAKRAQEQSQELQVLRTLEDHLSSLNERVNQSNVTHEGLANVEATLSELFHHIEDTRRAALDASVKADRLAQSETQVLQALQTQIEELSQRVYRTEHHVSALTSIEQGMSALFQEFRASQQTAADMTEKIVKEALTKQDGSLSAKVRHDIDELKQNQVASEQRTHYSLSSMHDTLNKVVDRIAFIEETGAPALMAGASQGVADHNIERHAKREQDVPSLPPTAPLPAAQHDMPLVAAFESHAHGQVDVAPQISVNPSDHAPSFELGMNGPHEAHAESVTQDYGSFDEQAHFINAARKSNGHKPLPRLTMTVADEPAQSGSDSLGKLRSLVSARKLLIAVTGFVVLLGAEEALQPRASLQMSAALAPIVQSPQIVSPSQPKTRLSLVTPTDQTASIPTLPPKRNVDARTDDQAVTDANATPAPNYSEQASHVPLQLLRDAAQNGNAAAQYELANRLMEGRDVTKDVFGAAMWYEKAALQNLAPAQYIIGTLYEKGTGVAKDVRRARDWYQRAADLGHIRAMHNLASLYADGIDGKPDYSTAAIWFRKAAEFGVRDSQYNLGILYGRGLGIELSLSQAYAWFAIAAQQGDDEAARKRDDVVTRLDQKQLAAGKTFVATFRKRTPDLASNEVIPQGGWDMLRADSKSTPSKTTRVVN